MLVKNIIRKSAEFLKLKSVIDYLDSLESDEVDNVEDASDIINDLLLSVNMVNTNIASSYIELINKIDVDVDKSVRLNFDNISSLSIIEIKSIKNYSNHNVKFKVYPNGVDVDFTGRVMIEYSYFPVDVELNGNIKHYLKLNELTFALGVASEYLYLQGAYEDALVWENRFKQNLFNLIRPKRNIILPQRSFD